MNINANFSQRAVVPVDEHRWVASPQPGVERMMLDRIGGEQARATSLVRYAPDSVFPAHGHPGGEEILVLSGMFCDSSGRYGPGWYLRNPPGSAHQPSSPDGALIFVKLRQMPSEDTRTVRIDTRQPAAWQRAEDQEAREICPLHRSAHEEVCPRRLPLGQALDLDTRGGAELLLLEGQLVAQAASLDCGSWLRLPPGAVCDWAAGPEGATFYLKSGHLLALAGLTP